MTATDVEARPQRSEPESTARSKEDTKQTKNKVLQVLVMLKKLALKLFGIVFNSDVLHIVRPLVYVCLVMRHGKRSWIPIQVSLAIDLFIICLVAIRLLGSEKLRHIERRDLAWRNYMALAKYLIRDPIFENYTLVAIQRVFRFLRIPNFLYGIVLSILNYYRYYTYIA